MAHLNFEAQNIDAQHSSLEKPADNTVAYSTQTTAK